MAAEGLPEGVEAVSNPDIRKVRLRYLGEVVSVPLSRGGRRVMRNRYRDLRHLGMTPGMTRSSVVSLLDTASYAARQSVWDDVENARRGAK